MSAIKFNLNLKDFHQAHKNRNHGEDDTASYNEFKTIVETMGSILGDEVIRTGKANFPGVRMYLRIIKVKNTFVDRKASKEAGERIEAFNDHSDGFVCRIKMNIGGEEVNNANVYYFKATRSLKRVKLKNAIRKNKSIIYNYPTVTRKYVKKKA